MIDWTATSQGGGIWLFEWTAVALRPYEIWHNGILIDTVTPADTDGEYTSTLAGFVSSPPPFEIHDTTANKAENEEYPPFAILQWRGLAGAGGYTVEQFLTIQASLERFPWTIVKTITESAAGWYSYNTVLLTDQVENEYRVKALNNKGAGGQAIEFDITVVRNPAPPDVALVVSGGDLIMEAP